MRLTVFLHGLCMEYRARATAASLFVSEWTALHGSHAVAVTVDDGRDLPRLPCERLYLGR